MAIAKNIIEDVQTLADHTQAEAYRYEMDGDKVIEVRCYPTPRFENEQPVPTEEREGMLSRKGGKLYRAKASIPDDAPKGKVKVTQNEAGDDVLRAPQHVLDFANESRRHGVRLIDQAADQPTAVGVRFDWVELDPERAPAVGESPDLIERDDIDKLV